MDLVFADQVTDGGIRNEYFERHYTPVACGFRKKGLTHDPFEHKRKLSTDLGLLCRRENVDNTVDGRIRRVRVECCERKVAGFSDSQGHFDRLKVTHFADEHNVRVLSKCGP